MSFRCRAARLAPTSAQLTPYLGSPTAADCRKRLTMLVATDFDGGVTGFKPLVSRVSRSASMRRAILSAIRSVWLPPPPSSTCLTPIRRPESAALVCVNSTGREEALAEQLGIRFLGALEEHLWMGTKGGSRALFQECGVPLAAGTPLRFNVRQVADDAWRLWVRLAAEASRGGPRVPTRAVVKLNDGFSGAGNAVMDASALRAAVLAGRGADLLRPEAVDRGIALVEQLFSRMAFQGDEENWSSFSGKMASVGALVEAFVEPQGTDGETTTPSCQAYIGASGNVVVASTHEQVMDASGQCYKGCAYPARVAYADTLASEGAKVAAAVAARGARGWLSVDFIAVRDSLKPSTPWRLYALEINLRPGGTTHPFMTAALLTGTTPVLTEVHTPRGCPPLSLTAATGQKLYYAATDNMSRPEFARVTPESAIAAIATHPRLRWVPLNPSRSFGGGYGVALYMLGCLSGAGDKVGAVAVARSADEAKAMLAETEAVIAAAAGTAHGGAGRSSL